MPPKNDPAHRHLKQSAHAARKSKPKFEVPAETGLPEAPVGWVYRADEVSATPAIAVSHAERGEKIDSKSHPFLIAGMGMFFIGVGTVGLVSLLTMSLIATPVRFTKGLFRK
jgi:hypothetical protein